MTHHALCIGIDGCPAGWIAVSRGACYIAQDLAMLLERIRPDIVALDMPIGLADNGPRACDQAARRLLGRPRGSSVFPTPTRAALAGRTHVEASDLNAAACGKRISAQTYHLLPKIREVDLLLCESPYWCARVFETHPEVSFAHMNGGAAITESKKTRAGRARRQALIATFFDQTSYPVARNAVRRRDAADDDMADAFACLFTAERIAGSAHTTLPAEPGIDAQGLPMQICY